MSRSLGSRLKEALSGPPTKSAAGVARACKVAPPSVSACISGDTKTIEASNAIAAAEYLEVNVKWLIDGVGPKRQTLFASHGAVHAVEPSPQLYPNKPYSPSTLAAIAIMESLLETDRRGALAALRSYVQNLDPPSHGQTLRMAEKNTRAA